MKAGTPVTIVCGPPGAGKSTLVRREMQPGDLVLDVDEIFKALTLLDMRQKPPQVLPFVLAARDAVLSLLAGGFLGPRRAWVIMCGEDNDVRGELAERLSADVLVLPVPVGKCLDRMRRQGRPEEHIREIAPVCEKWHRRFEMRPGEIVPVGQSEYGDDGWPV
jgi:hypothetical protein